MRLKFFYFEIRKFKIRIIWIFNPTWNVKNPSLLWDKQLTLSRDFSTISLQFLYEHPKDTFKWVVLNIMGRLFKS